MLAAKHCLESLRPWRHTQPVDWELFMLEGDLKEVSAGVTFQKGSTLKPQEGVCFQKLFLFCAFKKSLIKRQQRKQRAVNYRCIDML